MLINEAASILVTSATTNICCSVTECGALIHQTGAVRVLDKTSDTRLKGSNLNFGEMKWLTRWASWVLRPAVLTCMFVVWMCFLALVTASLLQEESSTLHHEEALTEAARQNGTEELGATKTQRLGLRHHAAGQPLSKLVSACCVDSKAEVWNVSQNARSSFNRTADISEQKTCLAAAAVCRSLSVTLQT